MSKCQHGAKLSVFCITKECDNKQVAGCPECIKKKHKHKNSDKLISEFEVNEMIKKFSVQSNIKPKCRIIQQSILKYSTQIKKQFQVYTDNICIEIMNQIGYPYLSQHNLFPAYKRIKKQQYNKINCKELRQLYQVSQKVKIEQLVQQQRLLYIKTIKQKFKYIQLIEKVMKNIYNLNNELDEPITFNHEPSLFKNIKQLIQSVLEISDSSNLEKAKRYNQQIKAQENKKISIENKSGQNQSRARNILDQLREKSRNKDENKQKINKKELIRRQLSKQKQEKLLNQQQATGQSLINDKVISRKRPQRLSSLDKNFTKSNKLQLFQINQKKTELKNNQPFYDKVIDHDNLIKPNSIPQGQKSSPKRRHMEVMETRISDKKQKLLDMMKNKQQSPNRFKNPLMRQIKKLGQFQINLQKSHLSQPRNSQPVDKNKNDMFQSAQSSEIGDKLYFGIANLPMEQQKKINTSHKVTKRTIVIPVEQDSLAMHSPIRRTMMKIKQNSPNVKRQSPKMNRLEIGQQQLSLNENEEKSMFLLLQAIDQRAEQAIVYLKKSLIYSEDNLSAAQYLSYLYIENNQPKQALNLCSKMLQKLKNSNEKENLSWYLLMNKSAALNSLGRFSQALNSLKEAQKLGSSQKLYKLFGDAYFSLGMVEKAIANYQKAVSQDDKYDEAHYNLAACYFSMENFHNAKFQIMKALQLCPNQQNYKQLRRQLAQRMKQY